MTKFDAPIRVTITVSQARQLIDVLPDDDDWSGLMLALDEAQGEVHQGNVDTIELVVEITK